MRVRVLHYGDNYLERAGEEWDSVLEIPVTLELSEEDRLLYERTYFNCKLNGPGLILEEKEGVQGTARSEGGGEYEVEIKAKSLTSLILAIKLMEEALGFEALTSS